MRVFVTGASGFIGTAVVADLLAAGHEVVGLARSDASADALSAAGAQVHRGDLGDLDSLRGGASSADGVIHLAYDHAFTDMVAAAETDLAAITAMGRSLEGSDRPLVMTSGTLLLSTLGRLGTEQDAPDSPLPRVASERAARDLATRGVRTSIVRLSPSVHGRDDHGFVPRLINLARDASVSAYVGDGANRWPAVHRLDAARLFRLALESGDAGSTFHGVGDEGIAFRELAGAIGRHLDVPVRSLTPDEAGGHFGFLGLLVALDNPTSNARTREQLGWEPVHASLLADLDEGHYFEL